MTAWHGIGLDEVSRLHEALESVVEMRTGYGRDRPDWDRIIREVEESEDGLDLGPDMTSPVIKALLAHGRQIYREMKDNL